MSRLNVQHSAKTEMGEMGTLRMRDLRAFVAGLSEVPDEAELIAIMGDKGTQRDPWPFLRGLKVEWSTTEAESPR